MENRKRRNIYGYKSWHDKLDPLAKDIRECAKKLEDDVFLTFVKTATAIERYLDAWLYNKPIGRIGIRLLHTLIWHGGRMTPTEISREILRSKYAVTRVVDSLVNGGFVVRESFGDDLRTRDIVITKRGIDIINEYSCYLNEHVIKHVFGQLNQNEIERLLSMILQLKNYLLAHMYDDLTDFRQIEYGDDIRKEIKKE